MFDGIDKRVQGPPSLDKQSIESQRGFNLNQQASDCQQGPFLNGLYILGL